MQANADCTKLYWMKLYTNFFDKHEIKILWNTNHEYVMLYIRLILESIPNRGVLKYNSDISYSYSDIALLFDMDPQTVKTGMETLIAKRLLIVEKDGTMKIPFTTKCLASETVWAEAKRRQRAHERLENGWKRINDKVMVSADGKQTITVNESECGKYGMLALSQADGKCEECGKNTDVVLFGGHGETTERDELKVLCHACAAKKMAEKTTGVSSKTLVTRSIRKPPQTFQDVLDYLTNEEHFLIVNQLALESKFNELFNRGWKDSSGRVIRDWRNYFMGMAARHLTNAIEKAKDSAATPTDHSFSAQEV